MNQIVQFKLFTLAKNHFIVWPSSVILTFSLPEKMSQMSNCAILFWNPCINVEAIVRTSSIYDHFLIWPSSVTLTFNLPESMFQMTLFLLKENNCAKLFWNWCTNVEVMALTNSIYDHFRPFDFQVWPPRLQPTWTNVSNGISTPQGEQ